MMGRRRRDQGKLFYEFHLDDRVPKNHLLRRIDVFVTAALADLHKELEPYYSEIGRPSVDPELMIRMLIIGYCCGIRSERRLSQEVELHLAYRWFCKLDLEDEVPHHSTFSLNRLGRFRESDVLRHVFERVVWAAMAMGLVKGEGFAVDASVLEANASRYHGKAPAELDWSEKRRQTRAVAEYLAALDEAAEPNPDRKPPKVISPSDDHEGEVLEVFATKRRDSITALKFLKRAMKRYGRPNAIVTDRLRSYGAALKVIGIVERQECGRWLNNRAENSHQPFRRRERVMQRFRAAKTLQKFAAAHASVHDLQAEPFCRPGRVASAGGLRALTNRDRPIHDW